jgi:hypothetical protein
MSDSPEPSDPAMTKNGKPSPRTTVESQYWLIAAIAVGAVFAAFAGVFVTGPLTGNSDNPDRRIETFLQQRRIDKLSKQVAVLQQQVVAAGRNGPAPNPPQARAINRRLDGLTGQLNDLQDAITPDPAKALRVALLQRDLQNVQASSRASLQAVRSDVDRQYDLMKFVVGTLGLGMLGVIGSVFIPAIRDRKKGVEGAQAAGGPRGI